MASLEAMEKAMKTWDGTWKSVVVLESWDSQEPMFLGWYDTEDEAEERLLEIVDKIRSEYPENEVNVYQHDDHAYIDIEKDTGNGKYYSTYTLQVSERRSCFENL